jgi:hypothetical protein
MTLAEVQSSTKKCKRATGTEFGTIITSEDSRSVLFQFTTAGKMFEIPLTLSDFIASDWELEPSARTFWLGTRKIISHEKEVLVLAAITTPDDQPPAYKTMDNKPWIKALEIMPEKE